MGNLALDVLTRQITDYQIEIENLKVKIADCAIKAHSTEPQAVNVIFDNLHKMSKLIDEVKPKEVMLEELFNTKLKIEDELEQAENNSKK